MTTKADRSDLLRMHDAASGSGNTSSISDASKPHVWKKKPTPVVIPANNQNASNPFSRRAMGDTLSTRSGASRKLGPPGNNTANQTVLNSVSSNQAKKGSKSQQSKYYHVDARSAVDIDVDEDLGESLRRPKSDSDSNDPLDSIKRNTTRRSTTRMDAGYNRRLPAPDGQATRRRQQKHALKSTDTSTVDLTRDDGSDNDSIQSASGFDEPLSNHRRSSPPIASGSVKKQVMLWEGKTKPSPASTRARSLTKLSTDNVPHLNFMSIKNQMKGRSTPHPLAPNNASSRDILSSTSDFVHNTKPSRSKKATVSAQPAHIVLPLLQWAHGCEINGDPKETTDPQFWFRYSPGTKVLEILDTPEGGALETFQVKQLLSSLDYTDLKRGDSDMVVVRISSRKSSPRRSSRNDRFTPGSSGANGKLVFKFPPRHPNLRNNDAYDKLVADWKDLAQHSGGKVGTVYGTAAKSLWEATVNAADVAYSPFLESSDISSKEKGANFNTDVETAPTSESRRITPAIANLVTGPLTRTRARRTTAETAPRSPAPDADELLLIYPPSGPGAVNLTRGDMQRLEPGQYLNDNLIEFGLKLWLNDFRETEPDLAEQVHIFNSFFYKKLQVKPREEGYKSVRKWTMKFDLFKKRYIIVPINEHMHWYLAIICNPEFVLKPPPLESPKDVSHIQTRKRKREEEASEMDASFGRLTTAPSPPEEQEHSTDSSLQRAASEGAVEAMLTTSTVSQDQAETVFATNDNPDPIPDLQYPFSDPVEPMDIDAGHPTMVTDMDVDLVSDTGASMGMSPMSPWPSEDDDVQTSSIRSTVDNDAIVIDDEGIKSVTVPVSRFYGTSNKGKERAVRDSPVGSEPRLQDEDEERDVAEAEEAAISPTESTYIFTFDSLSSRHPGAITTLKEYLKLEAKDKKGLEPSMTSDAIGRQAMVPCQPNYCDCGVYLIHFVQAFMKDPVRQSEVILNKKVKNYPLPERQRDWDADAVESLRERLLGRFVELSDKWKEQKTREPEKEGTKGKEKEKEVQKSAGEAAGATPSAVVLPTVVVDSDDEIEMVGSKSKALVKKTNQKGKTQSAAKGETKAARLR